jgi:hypothetical protein
MVAMIELPAPRTFHTTRYTEESRKAVGELPMAERLKMAKTMHVDHPAFREGYRFVERLHYPVGQGIVGKGCMEMLVGDFRSGKTRIVERYAADVNGRKADRKTTPVLHVECTSNWSAKQVFIAAIKGLTGATQSERPGTELLAALAMEMIHRFGVELWVIDDVGWVLHKSTRYATDLLTNLRKIQQAGLCNILLVGSAATHRLIEIGHPYIGCLPNHVVIGMDWHRGGRDDYVMYLDELDELLPVRRKSRLAVWAAHFYDLSNGSPAFTGLHVEDAAKRALAVGAERIEHEHLVAMGVHVRRPGDTFTHFVDRLDDKMVGLREVPK